MNAKDKEQDILQNSIVAPYFKYFISKSELQNSVQEFVKESESLSKAKEQFIPKIQDQPLLTAFFVWTEIELYGPLDYPNEVKIILEKNLINFLNSQSLPVIIKNVKNIHILKWIENIRTKNDISIGQKELLVRALLSFFKWIGEKIFSLDLYKIEDPDRERSKGKTLKYDTFIAFLEKLDNRYQIVAKLLYFGGTRTLAEVVNLKIENVIFEKQEIAYGHQKVSYPKHVFEDIKGLIDGRVMGKVFTGRKGAQLNPATIFKNFKEAASRMGLDPSFSPKILTSSF